MALRQQQGFSLLEALVAVAITSIGMAGIYAMVNASSARLDNTQQRGGLQAVAAEILGVLEANVSELSGFAQVLTDCATLDGRIGAALSDTNKALMLNWCQRLEAEQGGTSAQTTRVITVGDVVRADGVAFHVANVELTDGEGQTRVAVKRVFRATP